MNEPDEPAPTWFARTLEIIGGFLFVSLLLAYVFTDVNEVNALILAARQSVFGW